MGPLFPKILLIVALLGVWLFDDVAISKFLRTPNKFFPLIGLWYHSCRSFGFQSPRVPLLMLLNSSCPSNFLGIGQGLSLRWYCLVRTLLYLHISIPAIDMSQLLDIFLNWVSKVSMDVRYSFIAKFEDMTKGLSVSTWQSMGVFACLPYLQ